MKVPTRLAGENRKFSALVRRRSLSERSRQPAGMLPSAAGAMRRAAIAAKTVSQSVTQMYTISDAFFGSVSKEEKIL